MNVIDCVHIFIHKYLCRRPSPQRLVECEILSCEGSSANPYRKCYFGRHFKLRRWILCMKKQSFYIVFSGQGRRPLDLCLKICFRDGLTEYLLSRIVVQACLHEAQAANHVKIYRTNLLFFMFTISL